MARPSLHRPIYTPWRTADIGCRREVVLCETMIHASRIRRHCAVDRAPDGDERLYATLEPNLVPGALTGAAILRTEEMAVQGVKR